MALTIENGTGVAGADSYGTRSGFITYALNYYGETVADEDASDYSMRRAFDYLNGLKWKGTKTHGRSQVGAFPRTSLTDCESNAIGTTEIPAEIIQAQYELARAEKASPGVLSPQGSLLDALVRKQKVDVIEIEYDTSRLTPDLQNAAVFVESAMRLINCFLVNGGRSVRMTAAVTV